ncbi:MAG: hypothetical protein FWG39_03355 [Alphaproteobacteria bacterium]|nr:hypothetical protein [Alphaproteobacteria bacterium]
MKKIVFIFLFSFFSSVGVAQTDPAPLFNNTSTKAIKKTGELFKDMLKKNPKIVKSPMFRGTLGVTEMVAGQIMLRNGMKLSNEKTSTGDLIMVSSGAGMTIGGATLAGTFWANEAYAGHIYVFTAIGHGVGFIMGAAVMGKQMSNEKRCIEDALNANAWACCDVGKRALGMALTHRIAPGDSRFCKTVDGQTGVQACRAGGEWDMDCNSPSATSWCPGYDEPQKGLEVQMRPMYIGDDIIDGRRKSFFSSEHIKLSLVKACFQWECPKPLLRLGSKCVSETEFMIGMLQEIKKYITCPD